MAAVGGGIWWQQEGEETHILLKEIFCEPVAYKCSPLGQNYFRLHAPTAGWIYGGDAPAHERLRAAEENTGTHSRREEGKVLAQAPLPG